MTCEWDFVNNKGENAVRGSRFKQVTASKGVTLIVTAGSAFRRNRRECRISPWTWEVLTVGADVVCYEVWLSSWLS